MVDHPVAPVLLNRGANAAGDVVQRLVPRDLLPLAPAPVSHALERLQDAIRVVDLVEGPRDPSGSCAHDCRGAAGGPSILWMSRLSLST